MPKEQARQRVEAALAELKRCRELEALEYGEQYDEVARMEDESPAPDPCVEAFNQLVSAVAAYEAAGGHRDELELGAERDAVYRRLEGREALERWEEEGGA